MAEFHVALAFLLIAIGFMVATGIWAARFLRRTSEEIRQMGREHRASLESLTRSTLESGRVIQPELTEADRIRLAKMAEEAAKVPVQKRAEHKQSLTQLNDLVYRTLEDE